METDIISNLDMYLSHDRDSQRCIAAADQWEEIKLHMPTDVVRKCLSVSYKCVSSSPSSPPSSYTAALLTGEQVVDFVPERIEEDFIIHLARKVHDGE